MRVIYLRLLALFLTLLLTITFPACSTINSSTRLVIYNGQHVQTTEDLVALFRGDAKASIGLRNADENQLADQLIVEGRRSNADLIYTGNTLPLEYLAEHGLLARLPDSILALSNKKYDSPNGYFVGISARVSVLIYNPSLISKSKLPQHISDLANPEYKDMLALAPGETDLYPIIDSFVLAYGKNAALKWLEGLKMNATNHIYPDNESLVLAISRGQAAFGIANQYYYYRIRAELSASSVHCDISYFAPRDPGYVIDISGIALLKSAPHKSEALDFIRFLLSKKAQQLIGGYRVNNLQSISYEYPIDAGVSISKTEGETPFSQLQPYPITITELADGHQARSLLKEAGLL